jgi:hypothetical protein
MRSDATSMTVCRNLDGAYPPGLQEVDLRPSIHLAFYEL